MMPLGVDGWERDLILSRNSTHTNIDHTPVYKGADLFQF